MPEVENSDQQPKVTPIKCPYCESECSSDGKERYDKSAKLTQLEEDHVTVSQLREDLQEAKQTIERLQGVAETEEVPELPEVKAEKGPRVSFRLRI